MGLRTFFRYLGVNINGPTHLFGDNESVVTSGSFPHSPLRKRHHALSYHYAREAIASGAVDFQFILGHLNPADILSKHWGYQQVWTSALRPILFWKGDTSPLLLDSPPVPVGENRYCESEGGQNQSTPSTAIAGSEVHAKPQLPVPAINPTQLS